MNTHTHLLSKRIKHLTTFGLAVAFACPAACSIDVCMYVVPRTRSCWAHTQTHTNWRTVTNAGELRSAHCSRTQTQRTRTRSERVSKVNWSSREWRPAAKPLSIPQRSQTEKYGVGELWWGNLESCKRAPREGATCECVLLSVSMFSRFCTIINNKVVSWSNSYMLYWCENNIRIHIPLWNLAKTDNV